jgi:hypothetical protein
LPRRYAMLIIRHADIFIDARLLTPLLRRHCQLLLLCAIIDTIDYFRRFSPLIFRFRHFAFIADIDYFRFLFAAIADVSPPYFHAAFTPCRIIFRHCQADYYCRHFFG